MASLKAQSTFRFVQCKEYKDQSYVPTKVADPSTTSLSITASSTWIAAGVGENKGAVGIFPLKYDSYNKKSDAVVGGHSGPIADLAFSPFNPSVLATAGRQDGLLKLWTIPDGGLTQNLNQATASWGEFEGANSVAWHPTSDGILALGSRRQLNVFDATDAKSPKYTFSVDSNAKEIVNVAWNSNGSTVTALGKNGVAHVLDPRASDSKTALEPGHALGELKPQTALYVGDGLNSLFLAGLDKMRSPMYAFYDTRSMAKPVVSSTLGFSTGYLLPIYDPDTQLLLVTVRGSMQVSVFDLSQGSLSPVCQYSFKSGLKGLAIARKQALDIHSCEVNRMLGLTDKGIDPVAMSVPRRGAGVFHADLYPPTAAFEAAQTAEAYLKGGNVSPKTFQITDVVADKKAAVVLEVAVKKQEEAVQKKEQARTYTATTTRRNIEQTFASTVFKHTKGAEPNSKDLYNYMLQPYPKSLALCRNIRVNPTYFAFPWKTVGGSALAVMPLAKTGRCVDNPFLVRGHKSQFNCFDLSPFDLGRVVTGGDEGKALVFRVPDGGLTADLAKHDWEIETEGKVTHTRFHPYVADVLVTVSTNGTGTSVQFWVLTDADRKPAPKLTLPLHKEPVFDLAFSPDGYTVATTSRDGHTRLFDIRDNKMSADFEPDEGQRDTQVVFVNAHTILTIGFGKMSRRSMSMYDTKDTKTAVKKMELPGSTSVPIVHYDEDSCVLVMGSMGGRILSTFNVTPAASPFIEQLSEWTAATDLMGWAFLPKTVCDVKKVEIMKAVKLTKDAVLPLSFTVPRKRLEYFQDDIFIPTRSPEAWCGADAWLRGEAKEFAFVSMQPAAMLELSKAPKEALTDAQRKYQSFLEAKAKEKEAKPVGATGHSSSAEVRSHFAKVATQLPSKNRWDAAVDNSSNDVDDNEWS